MIILHARQLFDLILLAKGSDHYTHIALMPVLSLVFFYRNRKKNSLSGKVALFPGIFLVVAGMIFFVFLHSSSLQFVPVFVLSLSAISFLLMITGGTFIFWGVSVFTSYPFPWLLLLLSIPLPSRIVAVIITFFQHGSASVVDMLFSITGVTYLRDGLTFHLPNIGIFIAKECSGIRSSIALFITAVLLGHISSLRTWPAKMVLLGAVVPLTLLKNGIRITTLTILADKVDVKWLTDSHLHHDGGIVFFVIALLLLIAVLALIDRVERIIIALKKTWFSQGEKHVSSI